MQTSSPSDGKHSVRQIVIQWPSSEWLRKWFWRIVIAIVAIYVAYAVRDIWVPLLLAFLIATVLDPVVDRLEMRHWSRGAAATLIYGVFLAVLVTGIVLAYPHVAAQAKDIQDGLAAKFPDMSVVGLRKSLHDMGVDKNFSDVISRVVIGTSNTFRSSNQMAAYGLAAATNLVWLVVIPIISFYALRDYHLILAKALLLVPKERRELVQTAVAETTGVFGKYLRGMAIVSLLNGFATWLLLFLFHIPSALLIAMGATILYNVPYLGAIAINAMIAAVSFLHGGIHELYVVTGIGLLMHNVLFDQIISPRILGGHVGLHPILSIIALLVGNLLLGVVGMVLAVPIAACIQIGVLALVPKLSHEIEIHSDPVAETQTVAELEDEMLDAHTHTDATEELHRNVNTAVDEIEEMIEADNQREAEINEAAAQEEPAPKPK